MKEVLLQYGSAIQVCAAATVVVLLAWAAKRVKSKVIEGWTYSRYPIVGKIVAAQGIAFMTAATIYNGSKLFETDWWVAPVFLTTIVGSYWLVYEMFVVTLRWNNEQLEVSRPPFAKKSIEFSAVVSVRLHSTTESVTIRSMDGTSVWFPYSFRSGMAELFGKLSQSEETNDSASAEA